MSSMQTCAVVLLYKENPEMIYLFILIIKIETILME
jgi:hypothetical protein